MARGGDPSAGYVPPPLPPSGPSADFTRGNQQVGSGPQARAFAATANLPYGAFPPEVITPPDQLISMPISGGMSPMPPMPPMPPTPPPTVGSAVRDPENPYVAPTFVPPEPPSPAYAAAWYQRQPSSGSIAPFGVRGRPMAERLGVEPGMGGLARPEDATFMPSNVLIQSVLRDLPPIFQQFADRKINRPTALDIYGPPTSSGGYYEGLPNQTPAPGGPITPTPPPPTSANTSIVVGRGVERNESQLNAVNAARHELLHALSFEAQPFAQDANDNFRLLHYAALQDFASLQAPQYRGIADKIVGLAQRGDWAHIFTELADLSLRGTPMPPNLQRYFAPMYAIPVQARPMSAPPSAPPR